MAGASLLPQSERSRALATKLAAFMATQVHPADSATHRAPPPRLETLKAQARSVGLWSLLAQMGVEALRDG